MTKLGTLRRWSNLTRTWFEADVRSDLTDAAAIPTTAAVTAGIAAGSGGGLVTYDGTEPTITSGAVTFDLSTAHHFYVLVDENITAITVTNLPATSTEWVEWTIRFAGAGTIAFPTDDSFRFPGGVTSYTVASGEYLEVAVKSNSIRSSANAVVLS